jgi:hypothetical protein
MQRVHVVPKGTMPAAAPRLSTHAHEAALVTPQRLLAGARKANSACSLAFVYQAASCTGFRYPGMHRVRDDDGRNVARRGVFGVAAKYGERPA